MVSYYRIFGLGGKQCDPLEAGFTATIRRSFNEIGHRLSDTNLSCLMLIATEDPILNQLIVFFCLPFCITSNYVCAHITNLISWGGGDMLLGGISPSPV